MPQPPGRQPAPHIRAALLAAQAKPIVASPATGSRAAAHVQAAVSIAQAKLAVPTGRARAVVPSSGAAHVAAMVERARSVASGAALRPACPPGDGPGAIQGCFPAGLARLAQGAVQLKVQGPATQLPAAVAQLSGRGGGQPIPEAVRRTMEGVFGTDFSDVRVHVGPQAAALGALAFTLGSHIHFFPGHYAPGTPHGRRLLAHELTHVVQQRAGRVRNPFAGGLAVVQDPRLEAEAERMAARAVLQRTPAPLSFPRRGQVAQAAKDDKHHKSAGDGGSKEADKYERQNRMAASAVGEGAAKDATAHGNKQIDLGGLTSEKLAKKLVGFSSKHPRRLQFVTAFVPVHITQVNALVAAEVLRLEAVLAAGVSATTIFMDEDAKAERREEILASAALYLARELAERGLQLREPHVNDAKGLPSDGDMDAKMVGVADSVKRVWWRYARSTPSTGWERLSGRARPHTPQFAEIGMGGFVPRAIYDWYRNTFYLTPHYNEVEAKGLTNAYVLMTDAETWTEAQIIAAFPDAKDWKDG